MPEIVVLPHAELCPEGKTFEGKTGKSLLDNLLDQGIEVEHACEKSCACTTCHVIVREGFDSLPPSTEDEDDLLDRAWGLTPLSRLSCQAIVEDEKLVVEIPKYTINQREGGAMSMKWTDIARDRDRACRGASRRRSARRALHRSAQLGVRAAGLRRRPEALRREVLEAIQAAWIDEV